MINHLLWWTSWPRAREDPHAVTSSQTRNLFAMTDAMDVAALAPLFAEDGRVVFGTGQPSVGIDEIRTGITAFFDMIAGLHHEVVKEWNVGDDTIIELKVTYRRRMASRSPSRASRFSVPPPLERSTITACTSMWRPFMPNRGAQTRRGRANVQ
jgi:ketosteroid isomerase-like protein